MFNSSLSHHHQPKYQKQELKDKGNLNEDFFQEEHEKITSELNSSVFTFAQEHNTSFHNDQAQINHILAVNSSNNNAHSNYIEEEEVGAKQMTGSEEINYRVISSKDEMSFIFKDNENSTDPQYEICEHCSRKFFVGRLALHQKSCRPSHPLRPLNLVKLNKIKTVDTGQKYRNSNNNNKNTINKQSQQLSSSPSSSYFDSKHLISDHSQLNNPTSPLLVPSSSWSKISFSKSFDPITSQYVQCQYCLRKFKPCKIQSIKAHHNDYFLFFHEEVAEQHIPNCKNIFNRPNPPKQLYSKGSESQSTADFLKNFKCDQLTLSIPPSNKLRRVISKDSSENENDLQVRESVSPALNEKISILRQQKQNKIRQNKKIILFTHSETERSQLTTNQSSLKDDTQESTFQRYSFETIQFTKTHSQKDISTGFITPSSSHITSPSSSIVILPSINESSFSKKWGKSSKNNISTLPNSNECIQDNKSTKQIKKNTSNFSLNEKSLRLLLNKNKIQLFPNSCLSTTAANKTTKAAEIPMSFCTNCGSQLSSCFKYCSSCGKKKIE